MTQIRKGMLHNGPGIDPGPGIETESAATRIAKSGFSPTLQKPTSIDEDQNLVFMWANIAFDKSGRQVTDLQGHQIDVDDLEAAAYNFALKYRKTGSMHKGEGFGDMVESVVFTPEKMRHMGIPEGTLPVGWWVGFHVPDDEFAKVKSGEYRMASIQGAAKLEPAD